MSRLIPRGVAIAGLGKRFGAALLDALPVFVIGGLVYGAIRLGDSPTTMLVATIVGSVLAAGYGLYQWWAYASRGAGIGAKAMGIRLVGLRDGEPIGWWRFFLRQLVFGALMGTVIGGIALLVFLVIHERRQGWHDAAAKSVVVQPKVAEKRTSSAAKKLPAASTVGLPPHLSSSFSPQPGTTPQNWEGFAPEAPAQPKQPSPPAPDWLPGVHAEPINAQAPYAPPGRPPMQPGQWSAPQQPGFPGQGQQPPQGQGSPQPPPRRQPPSPPNDIEIRDDFPTPRKPQQNWIPLPTPSSVVEPAVRVRKREFGEVEDDEGTRIASLPTRSPSGRPGAEGWYVRLDDGREVDLVVPVLLGRNPQRTANDPEEVHLVPASGDGRMISRTHVMVGTDPRGVYVVDRGSTNGTALVTEGGELDPCPADTQVRVREGQQVSYGNRWFTVLRRPQQLS